MNTCVGKAMATFRALQSNAAFMQLMKGRSMSFEEDSEPTPTPVSAMPPPKNAPTKLGKSNIVDAYLDDIYCDSHRRSPGRRRSESPDPDEPVLASRLNPVHVLLATLSLPKTQQILQSEP